MRAEIISVGTELLLGQIIDTNAPYLSKVLSSLGIDVFYRVTVGDNPSRLVDAIRTALGRADLLITIGGLGPTEDDLTKEMIAEAIGDKLVVDEPSEALIRAFFERRGLTFTQNNLKQAFKPESGDVIPNRMGTAPGIVVEKNGKIIIALPGPPGEFIPLVDESVAPYLSRKTAGAPAVIESRVLRVTGIGESAAEDKIKELLSNTNPTIAPYAKGSEVHFRITAKASDKETALQMIEGLEAKARGILGDYVYGVDEQTLEFAVVSMLAERGVTLAAAESCTGGLIGHRITNIPGSSNVFLASIVAYSNDAKVEFLDVPEELIREKGAVSPEVAEAMAEGAARRTGADIAVSVTGIAGPGGGTEEKPVGLVYIGIKTPEGTHTTRNLFGGSRDDVKLRSSQTALIMVRNYLISMGNR